MKKKTKRILAGIAAVLIILACVLPLSGCGGAPSDSNDSKVTEEDISPMFTEVEQTSLWRIVYHKDTKVMYAVSRGHQAYGTFTLLVNPDGTPMLWEE